MPLYQVDVADAAAMCGDYLLGVEFLSAVGRVLPLNFIEDVVQFFALATRGDSNEAVLDLG